MSGNVGEWCADRCDDPYPVYVVSMANNPPRLGLGRVVRGRGNASGPDSVSNRHSYLPDCQYGDLGFRCVQDV